MARRREVSLDLTPELPQVVARDLNLYYRPQEKPTDPAVDTFVSSLNAWISNAGTKAVFAHEKKEKEVGEAEATKKWNEGRKDFKSLVEQGLIDRNANPYLIDKYKSLELNAKAKEFGTKLFQEYENKQVDQDTSPDAFTRFYKNQMDAYVKNNELGSYDAVELNKGFFNKTDGIRENLYNRHIQSQLDNIGKNYNKRFKENVVNELELGRTNDDVENEQSNIGNVITNLIKDNQGLRTNEELRDLVLEGIGEFIENTSDFDYARKVLDNLTDYIQSGTAPFKKIGVVKNKIDGLREDLDEEEAKALKSQQDAYNGQVAKEQIEVRKSLREKFKDDSFDFYNDYRKSDEYLNLSPEGKQEADKYYNQTQADYADRTSAEAEAIVLDLLNDNKVADANIFLDENRDQFARHDFFRYKDVEIPNTVIAGKDTLLRTPVYKNILKGFESSATSQSLLPEMKSHAIDNYVDFQKQIKQWLADNPETADFKFSERYLKFVEYINKLQSSYTSLPTTTPNVDETVTDEDMDKLMEENKSGGGSKKIVKETIDYAEEAKKFNKTLIPERPKDAGRGWLGKYKRENPDAISLEDLKELMKPKTLVSKRKLR